MTGASRDPANLDGMALEHWYRQSGRDVELDRDAEFVRNYNHFFGPTRSPQAASGRPARPDPSTTDVFERGPDGKLRPVAGWPTTGPFDFEAWSRNIDWPGVARDLGTIGLGSLGFLQGGAIAGAAAHARGYRLGGDVVRGRIEGHHPLSRFLGGPAKQTLSPLHASIHRMYHGSVRTGLRDAGFLNVGGRGGGKEDWAAYFRKHPEKWTEAVTILRRVTREFDKRNGTRISDSLEEALGKDQIPPNPFR